MKFQKYDDSSTDSSLPYKNEKLTRRAKIVHNELIDTDISTTTYGNGPLSIKDRKFTYNSDSTFILLNNLSSSSDNNKNRYERKINHVSRTKTKSRINNTKKETIIALN